MEVIFDCFFDETFARLERSGLKGRQKRRDVIDHLNAVITGTSQGLFHIVDIRMLYGSDVAKIRIKPNIIQFISLRFDIVTFQK